MNQSSPSSSSSPVASSWYMVSLCNFKSVCQIPPWVTMETKLYDCWLCFYEPVFWIMYLISNMLESYKRQQQTTNDIMTFSLNDDDYDDEGFYSDGLIPVTTACISTNSNTALAEDITVNTSEEEEEDDEVQSIRSNKSFKHTLKGHFQMIRQKQQSLNEIMKRSILRKSSKSSLLQSTSYESNNTITMKPSISSSSTSSTASSSSVSSNVSIISTSPPSPIVFLSSSPSSFVGQDQVHSDKTRPMHPLALERRPSISDSLLKSINLKRKQPATTTTTTSSSNQYDYHYLNIDARKESSPYLDPSSSHLHKPSLPIRRKTSPEFPSLLKK